MGEYSDRFAFTGLIDEVRVYSRALGADEIGKEAAVDAVLVYSFDDGKAADTSGKGNNGAVGGAASL